jgi:choline dehydrogenase-like flavoprotein
VVNRHSRILGINRLCPSIFGIFATIKAAQIELNQLVESISDQMEWIAPPLHGIVTCQSEALMDVTADQGVVNHLGEIFGYRNLYVNVGAIVPRAVGANPSRTSVALAERIADWMPV